MQIVEREMEEKVLHLLQYSKEAKGKLNSILAIMAYCLWSRP
jgi:hypothetical protein